MAKNYNKGKSAAAKSRKRRQTYGKRKKDSQVTHGCPTPMKVAYDSFESALYSINRGGNAGKGWGTYECICGWWHVTSEPGKLIRKFDEKYYRSADYTYVPYNKSTYSEDKRSWNSRKTSNGD